MISYYDGRLANRYFIPRDCNLSPIEIGEDELYGEPDRGSNLRGGVINEAREEWLQGQEQRQQGVGSQEVGKPRYGYEGSSNMRDDIAVPSHFWVTGIEKLLLSCTDEDIRKGENW